MIEQLITDMNKSLDNDCYFAALSLALILPDICGKAEYPNLNTKPTERYKRWFDEYIGQYEKAPKQDDNKDDMPYLSGEVVYQLRCSLLHQGTPNINSLNINAEENKIDDFTLVIERKKPFDIYADCSSIVSESINQKKKRSYRVNVRRLCLIISEVVQRYYEKNKDKFSFINYTVIDWDDEVEEMLRLSNPYEE